MDVCLLWMVCLQVDVALWRWCLVHRNNIDCGLSDYDREASIMKKPWPSRGCCTIRIYIYTYSYSLAKVLNRFFVLNYFLLGTNSSLRAIPDGIFRLRTLPWFRRLVADLLPRNPRFNPLSVHVWFVVHKVLLGQCFLLELVFAFSVFFHFRSGLIFVWLLSLQER
jgi:hypothetical protein